MTSWSAGERTSLCATVHGSQVCSSYTKIPHLCIEYYFHIYMQYIYVDYYPHIQYIYVDYYSHMQYIYVDYFSKRIIRKSDQPFGGIQLILCGDFLQLPPVVAPGEKRRFCFQVHQISHFNHVYCFLEHLYYPLHVVSIIRKVLETKSQRSKYSEYLSICWSQNIVIH